MLLIIEVPSLAKPVRARWLCKSRRWCGLLVLPLAVACTSARARSIVGPDGQTVLFISCGETGACYELAGRHCPAGYDIRRARGAVPESYLVLCRRAAGAPSAYYPPAPVAATPTRLAPVLQAPRQQGWPPPRESLDSAQHWPEQVQPPGAPPAPLAAPTPSAPPATSVGGGVDMSERADTSTVETLGRQEPDVGY